MVERSTRRARIARTRGIRALGVVMVGLVLSGCWSQIGYGPERRRFNPAETGLTIDNVERLQQAWAVDVATGDEPIVSAGRVVVRDSTRSTLGVRAFDVASGASLWDTQLVALPSEYWVLESAPVTTVSELLRVSYRWLSSGADCETEQLGLDPADGSVVETGAGLTSPPAQAGNSVARVVLAPDCNSNPDAPKWLDVTPASGTGWSYDLTGVESARIGQPTVAGDQVFLSVDSYVLAFALEGCGAATCEPTWRKYVGGTVRTIVAGQDDVYFGLYGALTAVDRATGDDAWTAQIGVGTGKLALAGDTLYAVADGKSQLPPETTTLHAFDVRSCSADCVPLWSAPLGGLASMSDGPVVAGDVVYVGRQIDGTHSVAAYAAAGCEAATCAPVAEVAVDGPPQGMSVAQGHLFVTTGRKLVAYSVS